MTCCAPLSDEDRALLQQQLTEAEAALHQLHIGGAVREFYDQNGERVVYSTANRVGLIGYINQLRLALGKCPMPGLVMRPAGVIF